MIGQTVSHYRIIEKLGEGGMGVVYKAEDLKLDRFVALKFLPRQLSADHETKARFIHEAKSASSLDHPNICAIHEIDETSDGQTFIVMPCYDGETLKERIARGRLGVDEAIDIVIQVGSGLAKAHERGIVHRDIKPGNILLTGDGQVKLVDFGVAKLAGQTAFTKTGARVGTVGYMSPEQALGEALDARSDVFSLGVVMYELLAGKLPFQGEHEAAILYSIIHVNVPPLYVYRPDVPEVVAEIVDRALAKEAGGRYADAGELVQDLEAVRAELRAGRPLPTRRRRRGARLRLGRRRVVVSFAAAVVVAVVAARLLWWPSAFSPSEALAVVDFRGLATADDPTTSAGMTNLVHTGLVESSPGVRVISPELLHDLRRRLFDSARGPIDADQALEVAREAGASLLLSGQSGTSGGAAYVTWQLVEVATGKSLAARRVDESDPIRIADQIIAAVLPFLADRSGEQLTTAPRSVADLTTSSPDALRHYVAGMLAVEEARSWDAIREFEEAVSVDSTFALAFFQLSQLQRLGLKRETARAYAATAWDLRGRLGVKDRMRLEAWRQMVDGNDAEAIGTYQEMLVRWPDDRKVLTDLGQVLFYKWRFDEAAKVARESLALYPDDAAPRMAYPKCLEYIGKPREALAVSKSYVERHPKEPNAWDELGVRYLSTGLPDSAEAAFNRALEIDPRFVWSRIGLGYCDYLRGDADGAIDMFGSILERGGISAPDSIAIFTEVSSWPGLALFYAESGRFEQAFDLLGEVGRRFTVPGGAPQTKQRIQLLLRVGRAREALHLAEELSAGARTRFERLSARHFRIRALVAVDSLGAARAAATELRADEEAAASGPFLRLRVETDIALATSRYDEALTALDEMSRHGVPLGGLNDIERRESIARALHGKGDSKKAIEVLGELLRIYGSHAEVHYQLGLIYENIGRDEQAREEYEAFLAAWARADDGLPQVVDARARLDALATGEK